MKDYKEYEEDYREEEENTPAWNETYLNTLGMSMSDFL